MNTKRSVLPRRALRRERMNAAAGSRVLHIAAALGLAAAAAAPAGAEIRLRFTPGETVALEVGTDALRQSFTLADVNNDGVPDLVAVALDAEDEDAIAVLINRGDGTFESPRYFTDPEADLLAPAAVAVADVGSVGAGPADGNPDVVAVTTDGFVIPAFGDGAGDFQIASADERFDLSDVTEGDLVAVVSGEFDGGSGSDVAVLDDAGFVFFLCNTGPAVFDLCPTAVLDTEGENPSAIGIGNLNGDASPDIAVLNQGPLGGGPGSVALFLGGSDGTFSKSALPAVAVGRPDATDLAVGRIDGDALDDVVVTFVEPLGGDSVQVLSGQGGGVLMAHPVVTGLSFFPAAVAIADFDQDGINDLVSPQGDADAFSAIMKGDGLGGFEQVGVPGTRTGTGTAVAAADLDQDGFPDFVVLRSEGDQLPVAINASGEMPTPTASAMPTASRPPTATPTVPATRTGTATVTETPAPTSTPTRDDGDDADGCVIQPRAHRGGFSLLLLPAVVLFRRAQRRRSCRG